MRRVAWLALGALIAPAGLAAQTPTRDVRTMRSFETATAIGLGFTSFGVRAKRDNGVTFDYTGSLAVDATIERPVTRRSGVSAGFTLSPLSKTRGGSDFGTIVQDFALLTAFDGLLLWRFKPSAPVLFGVGGGYTMATKSPVLEADASGLQWSSESGTFGSPHAAVIVGFDRDLAQRLGLRLRFALRFVGALDIDDPASGTRALSATDFAVTGMLRMRRANFR